MSDGAAWGTLPYPSDLFLDGDGKLTLTALPLGPAPTDTSVDNLIDALHSLDGAGVRSSVYFPIDGDLDPSSLAAAVVVVDVDASSPGNLVTVPVDLQWRPDLGVIVAAPTLGTILEFGHRYGAYVTSALRSAGGGDVVASTEFQAIRDLATAPSAGPVAAAQESMRDLLELVPAADRGELVVATQFRTNNEAALTVKMRDVVAATTPTVTADVVYGPEEDGPTGLQFVAGVGPADGIPGTFADGYGAQPHDQVSVIVNGTMQLPSFLSAVAGTDGFPELDGDGDPVVKGMHTVKYTLALPRQASWADLPVVVFVHGINRTRIDVLTQINTAAAKGMAVLAIDINYHGDRARVPRDEVNELLGTNVPDGFGDAAGLQPATVFFHLSASGGIPGYHPQAMGENLRQAALDVAALVEFVADGNVAPIRTKLATIDGLPDDLSFRDEAALLTESLGGMITGVTLAIERRLTVAYISSPAAGFPFPSMLHSPTFGPTFEAAMTGPYDIAARITNFDPVTDYRFDPIVMLFDSVVERGDALAYARTVLDGSLRDGAVPDVVMTMAFGDVVVSNDTQESFAKAMGLEYARFPGACTPASTPIRYVQMPAITAPVRGNIAGDAHTAALVQWNPTVHAALRKHTDYLYFDSQFPPIVPLNPPLELTDLQTEQIHALWSGFLDDHFDGGGAPTVFDPFVELPCD